MKLSATLKFYGLKIHRYLVYLAGFTVLAYAISGITHPVMAWFGASQVQYMPPSMTINKPIDSTIADIIESYHIDNARIIKIIPTENQKPLLQVTEDFFKPRRYFDLETQKEYRDYDKKQATFLAHHYTGINRLNIKDIVFQTEFDSEYPSINQLLPVYKVTYNTPDNLTAYIDTEISQLASLNNNFKTNLQIIFTNIHTLAFLNDYPFVRVGIISVLLLSLLTALITGVVLLYKMNSRKIADKKRKIHRVLAHIIWIPLLCMIISGLYHLIHSEFASKPQKARISPVFQITEKMTTIPQTDAKINDVTLVNYKDRLYYRLSYAALPVTKGEHDGHNAMQNKKFDGLSREKTATYSDAYTGNIASITDEDFIRYYAKRYSDAEIKSVSQLKFFGFGYDFRNKRLPVYKVIFNNKAGDIVFIDPATGMLVATSDRYNALENLSFSFLHKWNFALAFTSREMRDCFMVGFLLLLMTMTFLGIVMKQRYKKH
jgi:hypothetical protein